MSPEFRNEEAFRPSDFSPAFRMAADFGLGLTCHAGEFCGPSSIWETIQSLNVTRLGHGVRAYEDLALIEFIKDLGVTLEICPSSNLSLGVFQKPSDHPIRLLYDSGCNVTLNTDDPSFFEVSLWREYQDAIRYWNFRDCDLNKMTQNAINAAFCDDEIKTN